MTIAAALLLATTCQNVVAPTTIVGIAQRESGLDPDAVHVNLDGSVDRGLMQINSVNDLWLGLSEPFDPCQSIAAAARLLASFSLYNTGSTSRGIDNGYADAVTAAVRQVKAGASAAAIPARLSRPDFGAPSAASVFWHPKLAPGPTNPTH